MCLRLQLEEGLLVMDVECKLSVKATVDDPYLPVTILKNVKVIVISLDCS